MSPKFSETIIIIINFKNISIHKVQERKGEGGREKEVFSELLFTINVRRMNYNSRFYYNDVVVPQPQLSLNLKCRSNNKITIQTVHDVALHNIVFKTVCV